MIFIHNFKIIIGISYLLYTLYLYTQPLFSYLSNIKNTPVSKINLQKILFNIDNLLGKSTISRKEYNRILGQVIKNIKIIARKEELPKTTFIKISEYLAQYENFMPTAIGDNWDVNLFTSFLKNKRGSCVPFSLLYLIISEHLKLPVYGSLSPEHIFIKFSKGKENFNVETVYFEFNQLIYDPGTFISDEMYRRAFHIPMKALKEEAFLQKLNKKQVIGIYLNNIGALVLQDALSESQYEKFKNTAILGRKILLFSLKFYYNNFSTFLNLANFYILWLFDKEKAKKFLQLCKRILINKKTKRAIGEFLIKTKDPIFNNYITRTYLDSFTKQYLKSKFYIVMGNFKKAKKFSLKILQSNPTNEEYLSYYLYSLIKLNELDIARIVIDNFKKAYNVRINQLTYTIEGILNIYLYKEGFDKNDAIIRINNYIASIQWGNIINRYILEEYYNFLQDNKKVTEILGKYLLIF